MPKIRVDLSCLTDTPEGKLLRDIMYGGLIDVFDHSERSGFPNNGWHHTFRITADRGDIEAFLELVEERFRNIPRHQENLDAFLEHAATQMAA